MTVGSKLAGFALVATAASMAPMAHAATTFTFQFDGNKFLTPRGQIGAPIVGTGIFTSATDLQPGTYALTSLGSYTMSFNFNGGPSFGQSDILTPLSEIAVRISDYGAGVLRLQFTENGTGNGGPFHGSMDLRAAGNGLTFEPTFDGGNDYYLMGAQTFQYEGSYLALDNSGVPEPATWALMLIGFGFVGAAMRASGTRRRVRFAL